MAGRIAEARRRSRLDDRHLRSAAPDRSTGASATPVPISMAMSVKATISTPVPSSRSIPTPGNSSGISSSLRTTRMIGTRPKRPCSSISNWNGKPRKLVVQANRNAFFYVLDRETGEFLMGKPFARQTWAKGLDDKGRPRYLLPNVEPTPEGTPRLSRPRGRQPTGWRLPTTPQPGCSTSPSANSATSSIARSPFTRTANPIGAAASRADTEEKAYGNAKSDGPHHRRNASGTSATTSRPGPERSPPLADWFSPATKTAI